MVKKTDRPTTARHILIYDEDWEFLERFFGAGAPRHRRVGCSQQCRDYVHDGVMALRRRIRAAELMMGPEPDLDEEEEFENVG